MFESSQDAKRCKQRYAIVRGGNGIKFTTDPLPHNSKRCSLKKGKGQRREGEGERGEVGANRGKDEKLTITYGIFSSRIQRFIKKFGVLLVSWITDSFSVPALLYFFFFCFPFYPAFTFYFATFEKEKKSALKRQRKESPRALLFYFLPLLTFRLPAIGHY